MEGRRSSDQNFRFGFPREFVGNVFPRDKDVVSHAQFLRRQNTNLGIWKQNTPDNIVSKAVADKCQTSESIIIQNLSKAFLNCLVQEVEILAWQGNWDTGLQIVKINWLKTFRSKQDKGRNIF